MNFDDMFFLYEDKNYYFSYEGQDYFFVISDGITSLYVIYPDDSYDLIDYPAALNFGLTEFCL